MSTPARRICRAAQRRVAHASKALSEPQPRSLLARKPSGVTIPPISSWQSNPWARTTPQASGERSQAGGTKLVVALARPARTSMAFPCSRRRFVSSASLRKNSPWPRANPCAHKSPRGEKHRPLMRWEKPCMTRCAPLASRSRSQAQVSGCSSSGACSSWHGIARTVSARNGTPAAQTKSTARRQGSRVSGDTSWMDTSNAGGAFLGVEPFWDLPHRTDRRRLGWGAYPGSTHHGFPHVLEIGIFPACQDVAAATL